MVIKEPLFLGFSYVLELKKADIDACTGICVAEV